MTEAFEAWIREVQETWDRIYSEWGTKDKSAIYSERAEAFMLRVFEKACRPFHFFLEDWIQTHPTYAGGSPFGSDSGMYDKASREARSGVDSRQSAPAAAQSEGTPPQWGGSATAKSGSSSIPPRTCDKCGARYTPKVPAAKLCLKCWIAREKQKVVKP